MSSAITLTQSAPLSISETKRSAQQMLAQRAAIVECMSQVMRKEIDYGTVPGTPKPTLYKPGSEKILNLFHLAAQPHVEDLSTPDSIRYRVTITVIHTPTGTIAGYGVGEASSAESKYQWRAVVCQEEWEATPDDRRREKWKKGYDNKPAFCLQQVRAEMEDVANTILKMAKKRAQIDAVLTTTAASDIFAQDVEDLIAAGLDVAPEPGVTPEQAQALPQELQKKAAPPAQPQTQQRPAPQQQTQRPSVQTISSAQGSRFWAIAMKTHGDHKKIMEYLQSVLGVQRKDDIPVSMYEEAIRWAEGKGDL